MAKLTEAECKRFLDQLYRLNTRFRELDRQYGKPIISTASMYATLTEEEGRGIRREDFVVKGVHRSSLTRFVSLELYPFLSRLCTRKRRRGEVRMYVYKRSLRGVKRILFMELEETFRIFHHSRLWRHGGVAEEELLFFSNKHHLEICFVEL